jgi:amino acid transporter
MTWLARVTAFAGNANLLVAYLAFFLPPVGSGAARAALLTTVTVALAAVNVRGVRPGALVGGILAAAKLIPMFAFVLLGLFAMRRELWAFSTPPSYAGFGAAVLLYVFAFTGFEFAAIPAGEATSPRRDLPWCMIAALLIAAVLYTGIQSVCVGTLPGLALSKTAMADASLVFMGPVGATIIAVTALVSILGNLSAMVLVAPRMTYALAADGMMPRALGTVHPAYRTPHVSIVLFASLALALALGGTFIGMIRISAIARILPYLLTCAAVPVLRRRHSAESGRFRLRGGWTLPGAGIALCLWLFSQCSRQDLAAAAVALLAGFGLYALSRRPCQDVGD